MNKLLILLVSLLISFNSYADFNSGLDAYEDKDYATALRIWQPLAEAGDMDAQAMLGQMYLYGDGIPKNEEISSKWYELAAKQGDSVSQNFIGVAYELGIGVPKNYKTALKWYRLSAEKKDRYTDDQIQKDSLYYLGRMYQYGRGVPINSVIAHMWFNIGLSIGDTENRKLIRKLETKMDSNEILLAKDLAKKCKLLNYKCTELFKDEKKVVKKDAKYFEAIRIAQKEQEKLKEKEISKIEETEAEAERQRVADAKKVEDAEAKRQKLAQENLDKKLSLIPPKTELQKAQDFLADVEIYISINPSEFDIMEIAMLKINTQLMIEGVANNEQLSNLKSFKEFAKTSYSFSDFEKERQDGRNQVELNKIDQVIINLETVIVRLKSLSKENITSNSASRLDEKINSAILIISNPKTLLELEDAYEDLLLLLSNLEKEIKRSIDAKNAEILLVKNLNKELTIVDQNINKLKTYLQENFSSISSELLPLLINNINILENTSKQTFISKEEKLKALLKVNKEISNFKLKNNIIPSDEIAQIKKAEEKRIADTGKEEIVKEKVVELIADDKKKKRRYPDLSSIFYYEHPGNYGISIAQKSYDRGDYVTTFETLKKCSDYSNFGYIPGYQTACPVYLGMMYLEGIGTEQNTDLALKVLREWNYAKNSELSSFHDWRFPRISKYYEELLASAKKKLNEERKADGKTVISNAFSVIYEHESKGTKYQVLQEYKSNNTITRIYKGDDGSSYLDYKTEGSPIDTWKWHYDGSDSNGERFIYSEVSLDCLTSECKTVTNQVFADYIYDFDNNIVTVVIREDGSIWKEGGTKIISHNFGNPSKKIGENFINTVERKSLNNCSDISNNQIDSSLKGYKDVFFGMTKDEFRILAKCNNGSLYDIKNHGYVQDDSRYVGDNLIIFELNNDRYQYNVNAIFSGPGVTEISVRTYSEYHNVMRINSKSSGITGIDKIKDLLEKKYSLLIKPSDESIEKYNEYIGWNEVDFVFQNKDTQNLVILRVGYRDPDVLGLKYSYQGNIHYLSERASKTYLNNIQSEVLSEDDF